MTPAARVQAAIAILDKVIEAAKGQGAPADRIVADWAKANRYAGSKDRRAVRELVYDAIRHCGPVPENGRAAMLALAKRDTTIAALFDGSQYGPETIQPDEPVAKTGFAPAWLAKRLSASDVKGADALSSLLAEVADGYALGVAQYVEYTRTMKGRRSVVFSRGLRDKYLPEIEDHCQEVAGRHVSGPQAHLGPQRLLRLFQLALLEEDVAPGQLGFGDPGIEGEGVIEGLHRLVPGSLAGVGLTQEHVEGRPVGMLDQEPLEGLLGLFEAVAPYQGEGIGVAERGIPIPQRVVP